MTSSCKCRFCRSHIYIGSLELEEPVYFIYVVSESGYLQGYIQIWELLKTTHLEKQLSNLAVKDTISVKTDTDQGGRSNSIEI